MHFALMSCRVSWAWLNWVEEVSPAHNRQQILRLPKLWVTSVCPVRIGLAVGFKVPPLLKPICLVLNVYIAFLPHTQFESCIMAAI